MSRKHKNHEEHVDEGWLLPYSDLMTLLLALFIVLFATSSTDENKLKQMSEVFREMFTGATGILEYNAPADTEQVKNAPVLSENELKEQVEEYIEDSNKKEMENLEDIKKEIDKYIEQKNLGLELSTDLTDKGLMITIQDKALFDSGSADVKKNALPLAREISELLITDPVREVYISGHTDNVPISTEEFKSNWELSAIRAINFLKIVLENKKHDPKNFTASGSGEYNPIADNKTDAGKAKNRRVEILILPNKEK